jgi:alkanesulfonate monooxygenase SsuD/methylene tetrahydromethanopterin reductase-like flavin-dependent oxidoreductase (luciferase family)
MRFGVFYELQLPRPWNEGDERNLFHQALEQVELADRLGFDYAWEVEHHFLEDYSHSSAPEVFLAFVAARTRRIRLGHGVRQVIPNYNHPARTAEGLATLDIISDGRVDFGIGEGATRLELGGFRIPAKEKRAMALEAAEQIANMMVLEPYPGFEGKYFAMPCRNVLPKPVQKPHRRSGWRAPTATRSRSRRRTASARSPSPFSTAKKQRAGPISITASSSPTPACRSAMR